MKHRLFTIALFCTITSITAMHHTIKNNGYTTNNILFLDHSVFSRNIIPYIRDEDTENLKLTSKTLYHMIHNWYKQRLQSLNTVKTYIQGIPDIIQESLVLDPTNDRAYILGYKSEQNSVENHTFGLFSYSLPIIHKPIFSSLQVEMNPITPKKFIIHTPHHLGSVIYNQTQIPSQELGLLRCTKQNQSIIFLNKNGQVTIEKVDNSTTVVEHAKIVSVPQIGIKQYYSAEQEVITYQDYSNLLNSNKKRPLRDIYKIFPKFAEDLMQTIHTKETIAQENRNNILYCEIEREFDTLPASWVKSIDALRSYWKLYHDIHYADERNKPVLLHETLTKLPNKICIDICAVLCMNYPDNVTIYADYYTNIKNKILHSYSYSPFLHNKTNFAFDNFIRHVKISPLDYTSQNFCNPLPEPTTTQQLVSFLDSIY